MIAPLSESAPRRRKRRGAVAIEYAILLPAFLLLTLGAVEMGRLMWTQITLDRAVQAAARCAVVNKTICADGSTTATYAAQQSWGMTVPSTAFTVADAACGKKVTASRPFVFDAPLISPNLTLGASACYPVPPAS